MRQVVWKVVTHAPGILALAIVVFHLLDGSLSYSSAPSSANASTGHVVPVFVHGRTLYLTQPQADRKGVFHWSKLVLYSAIVVVVIQRSRADRGASKDGA